MTVQSFDPNATPEGLNVTMTEAAQSHFSKQLQKADKKAVRLFIQESGCSGYMYRVELVDDSVAGDAQIDLANSMKLYVSDEAKAIVQGTEIDFKKDGLNEVVKFNNPNVTGECGCGESFVVEEKA
jgi:iron-sulfur cluster assembly accessory protein